MPNTPLTTFGEMEMWQKAYDAAVTKAIAEKQSSPLKPGDEVWLRVKVVRINDYAVEVTFKIWGGDLMETWVKLSDIKPATGEGSV